MTKREANTMLQRAQQALNALLDVSGPVKDLTPSDRNLLVRTERLITRMISEIQGGGEA